MSDLVYLVIASPLRLKKAARDRSATASALAQCTMKLPKGANVGDLCRQLVSLLESGSYTHAESVDSATRFEISRKGRLLRPEETAVADYAEPTLLYVSDPLASVRSHAFRRHVRVHRAALWRRTASSAGAESSGLTQLQELGIPVEEIAAGRRLLAAAHPLADTESLREAEDAFLADNLEDSVRALNGVPLRSEEDLQMRGVPVLAASALPLPLTASMSLRALVFLLVLVYMLGPVVLPLLLFEGIVSTEVFIPLAWLSMMHLYGWF